MKEVIFVIVLIAIAWLIVMLLMVAGMAAGHVIASLVCRWLEKGDD